MAYSEDLRIRLVRKVASGMSRRQAAAHFEVSPSTAVRYARRYEDEGTVAVKARAKQKRRLDPYGDDILGWIEETPDMTLDELSARLRDIQARAPKSTEARAWRMVLATSANSGSAGTSSGSTPRPTKREIRAS